MSGARSSGALGRVFAALRRAAAVALLPASILPVFVFGPGIAHAPERLARRVISAVGELER